MSLIGGSRIKVLLAALAAVALLGACGGGDDDATEPAADPVETSEDAAGDDVAEDDTEGDAEGAVLEFAGTEYAFSAPSTVPAGPTTVTLVNNGEEPHMLDLVALKEKAPSLDKLLKMPQNKARSFFAAPPTSIPPIKPGETSEAVDVNLQPGRYAYVCFYSEKGEKPHAFLGMVGELTVE